MGKSQFFWLKTVLFGLVFSVCYLSTLLAQSVDSGMVLKSYPSGDFYRVSDTTSERVLYTGRTQLGVTSCNNLPSGEECNSCSGISSFNNGGLSVACNSNEVFRNKLFTITAQTSATAGNFTASSKVLAWIVPTGTAQKVEIFETSLGNIAPTAGKDIVISLKWGDICNAVGASQDCNSSFRATLKIGIDKDNTQNGTFSEYVQFTISHRFVFDTPLAVISETAVPAKDSDGFYYFTVYPGDSKVYIDKVALPVANSIVPAATTTGAASGATATEDVSKQTYSAMRVFAKPCQTNGACAAGDFSSIDGSSEAWDLEYDGTAEKLTKNKVTNLVNGQSYVFAIASVDQGGNVSYFTDVNQGLNADLSAANYGLTQAATPQAVNGLLDDQKCFIATAAFGSPMNEKVSILRAFRSQFLLKFSLGKYFVSKYYQYSPPMAEWLMEHPQYKPMVRTVLWPMIFLANSFLQMGPWGSLLILFAMISFVTYFIFKRRALA